MPRALDPDAVFALVLDSDADKPPESRPAFLYRPVTGREWRRLALIGDDIEGAASGVAALDALFASLRVGLAGWRNMRDPAGNEIPFDPAELDALLDPREANELLFKLLESVSVSGDDAKKYGSRSRSGTEDSAATASPDGAETPPAS